MQKLRSIQVLRAIAACAVVVFHTYDPGGNSDYGAAGVDLFFVISGFIMANVAQDRTAGEFARDRMWRIYPMWWIALIPWLLMVPRGPVFLLSSVTLWPVYGSGFVVPVLKVGWTLCFELLFYAGMTIAIATRAWVPLAAYALFLIGAMTTSVDLFQFAGSPMVLEFLMGVVVARLPRRAMFGLFIPIGIGLLSLTPAVTGDLEWSLNPQWAMWRAFEWGCPAALIVWGALSLEPLFRHPLFNGPVAIGDASYSIYLFHPLISYGFSFWWPIRMALAVGAGFAMYMLVERRLLRARKHWPTVVSELRRKIGLQVKPA